MALSEVGASSAMKNSKIKMKNDNSVTLHFAV
jgi:hypothetical protein